MAESGNNTPMVTCGIVTFNNESIIEETLTSVLAQMGRGRVSQVIVWDNASTDRTVQTVENIAGDSNLVRLEKSPRNLGFGAGHNRILDLVNSDYHLICNPDITVSDGAVGELIRVLESQPEVGLIAPRVQFPDGRLQPLNKRDPSVFDLFLRRFLPGKFRPLFKKRMARYEMLDCGYEEPCEVPFLSGAFLVGRTDVLKSLGGFDERYFLYFEDADLTRELRNRGWSTLYWPGAVVTHLWKRDAHNSVKGGLCFVKSGFRYFRKWGWAWF